MKNLSSTQILIFSLLFATLLFGGLLFYMRQNKPVEQVTLPLNLVEFADYQCPACASYAPLIEQVKTEFSEEELIFTFKHLPLETIHPNAYPAALAAEAAREQGKFDEYSNLLFENQENLSDEDLVKYASDLSLDVDKFNIDRASEAVKSRVDADIAEADEKGYNSTPTFVLDGKRLSLGSDPENKLRQLIQERIDLAKSQQSK